MLISFKLNYRKVRKLSKNTETVIKSTGIVIVSANVKCYVQRRKTIRLKILLVLHNILWIEDPDKTFSSPIQSHSIQCFCYYEREKDNVLYCLAISKIRWWRCKMIPCNEPEGALFHFHWMFQSGMDWFAYVLEYYLEHPISIICLSMPREM